MTTSNIQSILLLLMISVGSCLQLSGEIKLYPNTQNSPSLYILPFTITKAIPTNSYILVALDWYSVASMNVKPYNCILVNTTIPITCTNLATLTTLTSQVLKINSKLTATKTISVQVKSPLLAGVKYLLQLHLFNVVPNIQKISSNIEMYTISQGGLLYQANTNIGAVVNSFPNNNLMGVSILNDLSANVPGAISTLRAQLTITQPISTTLSSLLFVMQYPFSFSIGSIPSISHSSLYSTNQIALYKAPAIHSYEVVSPNIFRIIFNEQFASGRKFIIQINQITNPFFIASTNISIYSLNFNTLTPLQAFQMLYPIATTSYSLTVNLGMPYDAPIQNSMNLYYQMRQFVQVKIAIPYSVPDGYSIRLDLTNAQFYSGTAYANFQSLSYNTTYTYSTYTLTLSDFGPIPIGTVVSVVFQMYIQTLSLFPVKVYIDQKAKIGTCVSTKCLYYGLVQGNAISSSNFFQNSYQSSTDRINMYSSINLGQWIVVTRIYQNINPIATSAGSYVDIYLPPSVTIGSNFDQNTNCRLYQSAFQANWLSNSCLVDILRTPSYVKLTVRANANYLLTVPNLFPYQSYTYIQMNNIAYTTVSTNKNVYPIYCTLYKSDVVNPTAYHSFRIVQIHPQFNTLSGLSLNFVSNLYSTTGATNFQTYPGVVRIQSTTPASFNSLVPQPNQVLSMVLMSVYGFNSFPLITNMQSYPCTSNIPVQCVYYSGINSWQRSFMNGRISITFLDLSYKTTPFHILIPDMPINQKSHLFYLHIGFYSKLNKDWLFSSAESFQRSWPSWVSNPVSSGALLSTMGADITGRAGAYRNNVSVSVYNNGIQLGGQSFVMLCTQWSFFENGESSLSSATLLSTTPATFGTNNLSPLGLYLTGGMYLTIIPFSYIISISPLSIYLDRVHMPYTYDLPTYYIYTMRQSDKLIVSYNSYLMMNGGTLYGCPLQSLSISCRDNAIGVVNTYCTVNFGTSNPLLLSGNIRITFSGMTVATNRCYLSSTNGTTIPVTCISSSDNKNVTVTMTSSGFYQIGNYTLVVYGVGITKNTLSQSITFYLYDDTIQYIIESGVRILMTTIANLDYISLSQIVYSYINPLSYNTMKIQFSLPRVLYEDQQFAFVIGQDLSDVNSENARLNIQIVRDDGVILKPLFTIDNVNYLIIFTFTDPSQLTANSYVMTIYGICTPASQANGAFNMIYRRTYDFTYTLVNSANVIFPSFNNLVTSDISIASYFNSEGYKQQVQITLVNSQKNVDEKMVWIINFPSYYSPQLFQNDAYCMIDTAVIPCSVDITTPYQLIVYNSPKTVYAGTSYKITLVGLDCPRLLYTGGVFQSRYMFVGVLQSLSSTYYIERSLMLPYQTIQSTVNGIVRIIDMVGVSASNQYSFSSIYAQFKLTCNVAITSSSYLNLDFPNEFDNLNNIALNIIISFSSSTLTTISTVTNRRIQILISANIAANTDFIVQIPSLPTPKTLCSVKMSKIIATVTLSNRLSIYAASTQQSNSAPVLNFVTNARYISLNHDQTVTITAGTYSPLIPITTNDNSAFLSNVNLILSSSGFMFTPSRIFLPIGEKKRQFSIGADGDLQPVVYFYQAAKQEEVNTNYQITLNMNIQVTNAPVSIPLPSTISMPQGGCTAPMLISLAAPPFKDVTISYTFDNNIYSQANFFPNPLTTKSQMNFNSSLTNSTFSFCSSASLQIGQIPIIFHLSGTNYQSYKFSPSETLIIDVVSSIPNTIPTIALALKNQQRTFLDVNFTNNVDGMIFYHLKLGKNQQTLDDQSIQVFLKSSKWTLESQSDYNVRVYTTDRDERVTQFYQQASMTPIRINGLLPQSPYTLCAYLVNAYSVVSSKTCLQVSTMSWGTVTKANVRFSKTLSTQQLNNVLCFFTLAVGTSEQYLVDMQGNSCGNRAVSNVYYNYPGTSVSAEKKGTAIYLITNPNIIGTDPSPLAFSNLFNAQGQLSLTTLSSAQTSFSINYLTATFVNTYDSQIAKSGSKANALSVYFQSPLYTSGTGVLKINNIRIVGSVGTIYFALVLYKQISALADGTVQVNIRLNYPPTAEQILNCQNWQGNSLQGCTRVVYTGVQALSVTFTALQNDSIYMLYYIPASQFALRPIVGSEVFSQSIVTYNSASYLQIVIIAIIMIFTV